MPVDYVSRLAQAQEALEKRTKARRQGAEISARSLRRDRKRLQALEWHPAVQPVQQEPTFQPAGIQGITAPRFSGDVWTQWQTCPSFGGRSGRRMSDVARYNSEAGLLQVRFASGGSGGVGNTYQYSDVDAETWNDFMAGRWAEDGTATHWFLMNWGGVRVS
jgi:KTSC domain